MNFLRINKPGEEFKSQVSLDERTPVLDYTQHGDRKSFRGAVQNKHRSCVQSTRPCGQFTYCRLNFDSLHSL